MEKPSTLLDMTGHYFIYYYNILHIYNIMPNNSVQLNYIL